MNTYSKDFIGRCRALRGLRRLTVGLVAAIGIVGGAGSVAAQPLDWDTLHHSAPERYTVVPGDTLWDIAGRFLKSPWQWPELWRDNPQIGNPHRIYPGDHLTLQDCDGSPCVKLERGRNVVKLSPRMRTLPPREAIEPIPLNITRAFLNDHRVVNDPQNLDELAYVVAGDDRRLISGAGDRIYARGHVSGSGRFGIYRMGEAYLSPEGDFLGQELEGIGEARHVRTDGDIVQLEVLEARREIRNDDIVLPLESRALASEFQPRPPLNDIEGRIIAAPGGVRFIGRLQVVTLNRGTLHGLQPGHVLRVEQQGERVHDPRTQEVLQLPGEEAGAVMVFRPYDQVSYALVMRASRTLEVGDRVHRPD